jgi:hypothetical protein
LSDIPQAPDWWQASDGKWYAPQAGQPTQDPFAQMQQGSTVPPAAPPFANLGMGGYDPTRAGRGCMSLGVIITIVTLLIGGAITAVVLFAVDDATDAINDTFDDDVRDSVEVTDCHRAEDRLNSASATLDVTNDGDESATYFVTVTFESRNGNRQFGTGTAIVSGLAAGNTIEAETGGIVEIPDDTRFTCRVTEARRTATG